MSLPILEEPEPLEHERLLAAAKNTADDDCLSFHQYCGAECCSRFSFPDDGQDLSAKYLFFVQRLSPDHMRYYELHGAKYAHGRLRVPTRQAVRYDGLIVFRERCDFLTDDNRCRFHSTNKQPRVCRELTMSRVREKSTHSGMTLTPRCLFKFKMEAER